MVLDDMISVVNGCGKILGLIKGVNYLGQI